jgi:uncharacterized Zn finger protein
MLNQSNKVTPQDIINAKSVKCEQCESETFTNVFIIKSISALLSPSGKEINVPIPLFACSKCGHINKNFLPDEA